MRRGLITLPYCECISGHSGLVSFFTASLDFISLLVDLLLILLVTSLNNYKTKKWHNSLSYSSYRTKLSHPLHIFIKIRVWNRSRTLANSNMKILHWCRLVQLVFRQFFYFIMGFTFNSTTHSHHSSVPIQVAKIKLISNYIHRLHLFPRNMTITRLDISWTFTQILQELSWYTAFQQSCFSSQQFNSTYQHFKANYSQFLAQYKRSPHADWT